MTTILTIDDEPQIRRFLRISLTSQGYNVIEAVDGASGLAQSGLAQPDLVILDLGLPDMDGKEVLRQILAHQSSLPVLVLSVRSSETEKVAALDMGAEDYVVKPFSVNELLARVRRILSSRTGQGKSLAPTYQDGDLFIDATQMLVKCRGQAVSLTRKEWAVLQRLIQSPGRLETQSSLLESIWGRTHRDDTQYLRNVIRQLRLKFGDNAANPLYIETEPGVGYRFIDRRT